MGVKLSLTALTLTLLSLGPGMGVAQEPLSGAISGTVLDPSGAAVRSATVTLSLGQKSTQTDAAGRFSFEALAAGTFRLTVSAPDFRARVVEGALAAGETQELPAISLELTASQSALEVTLSQQEVAEEQLHAEEKQRLLGAIPNFLATYDPHAVPLTSKQKFKLISKLTFDPTSFVFAGLIAGVEQADNAYKGYGQGAQGYGKRYAAAYGDFLIGSTIGGAILPSLFHQDPRYFYKGEGSVRSRALYAIERSVICRGDNLRWQLNYSNILGNLAAGGISNLYYPQSDRKGAGLTFRNTGIGIGAEAASNLLQEFLFRRLTPSASGKRKKP